MVDDQDRCEWVNVSSGSGSGLTWVVPGKGHTVVVVLLLSPQKKVLIVIISSKINKGTPSFNIILS